MSIKEEGDGSNAPVDPPANDQRLKDVGGDALCASGSANLTQVDIVIAGHQMHVHSH